MQPNIALKRNGANFDLCSHELDEPEIMKDFACPYRTRMCHEKNQMIKLDPSKNSTKLIAAYGSGFKNGESCYYSIVP